MRGDGEERERETEKQCQASCSFPIQESVAYLPSKPGCDREWDTPESVSLLGDIYSFCQG